MAIIRELSYGVRLDDTVCPEVSRDVIGLCWLLAQCVSDSVVILSLFEAAQKASHAEPGRYDRDAWERDTERTRAREQELEAADPRPWGSPGHWDWLKANRNQARRDVQRVKWAEEGGPKSYRDRHKFIHARSFVNTLARFRRGLIAIKQYEVGQAEAALAAFDAALPGLTGVRDSGEHAEDRLRWKVRSKPLVPGPVNNGMIQAPGGGSLILDSLCNNVFGCTIADGSFAEVEISDTATLAAQVAAQAVFDSLPWKSGIRIDEPFS